MRNRLLQFFQSHFKDEGNFSIHDYRHAYGKASDALLYSTLYLPQFVEIDGSVLLDRLLETDAEVTRFKEIKKSRQHDIQELEASFNFIEVGYLFDVAGSDTSDDDDELLACLIRDAWDAWLHHCYPDRRFKVEVLSSEQTGSTVGVHFYEIQ